MNLIANDPYNSGTDSERTNFDPLRSLRNGMPVPIDAGPFDVERTDGHVHLRAMATSRLEPLIGILLFWLFGFFIVAALISAGKPLSTITLVSGGYGLFAMLCSVVTVVATTTRNKANALKAPFASINLAGNTVDIDGVTSSSTVKLIAIRICRYRLELVGATGSRYSYLTIIFALVAELNGAQQYRGVVGTFHSGYSLRKCARRIGEQIGVPVRVCKERTDVRSSEVRGCFSGSLPSKQLG